MDCDDSGTFLLYTSVINLRNSLTLLFLIDANTFMNFKKISCQGKYVINIIALAEEGSCLQNPSLHCNLKIRKLVANVFNNLLCLKFSLPLHLCLLTQKNKKLYFRWNDKNKITYMQIKLISSYNLDFWFQRICVRW